MPAPLTGNPPYLLTTQPQLSTHIHTHPEISSNLPSSAEIPPPPPLLIIFLFTRYFYSESKVCNTGRFHLLKSGAVSYKIWIWRQTEISMHTSWSHADSVFHYSPQLSRLKRKTLDSFILAPTHTFFRLASDFVVSFFSTNHFVLDLYVGMTQKHLIVSKHWNEEK